MGYGRGNLLQVQVALKSALAANFESEHPLSPTLHSLSRRLPRSLLELVLHDIKNPYNPLTRRLTS
jgi:hypothetical protein